MISVVMPTFNRAQTLPRAIASVLEQGCRLELLIVDDGSTDNTADVLSEYATDSRVVVIKLERNQGVSAARNAGLIRARGDFIAFCDSDDCMEPGSLLFFLQVASENPQVDLFYGDGFWSEVNAPVPSIEWHDIPYIQGIALNTSFWRRTVALLFDVEIRDGFEEWFLLLDLFPTIRAKHCSRVVSQIHRDCDNHLMGGRDETYIEALYQKTALRHVQRRQIKLGADLVLCTIDQQTQPSEVFEFINHLRLFYGQPYDLVFFCRHGLPEQRTTFGFPHLASRQDVFTYLEKSDCRRLFVCTVAVRLSEQFFVPQLPDDHVVFPRVVTAADCVVEKFDSNYLPIPNIVRRLRADHTAGAYSNDVCWLDTGALLGQRELHHIREEQLMVLMTRLVGI